MRIQFLTDLHLEVAPYAPAVTGADLVVLAGDIDNGAAALGRFDHLVEDVRAGIVRDLVEHQGCLVSAARLPAGRRA